jgi:hypothetical protein
MPVMPGLRTMPVQPYTSNFATCRACDVHAGKSCAPSPMNLLLATHCCTCHLDSPAAAAGSKACAWTLGCCSSSALYCILTANNESHRVHRVQLASHAKQSQHQRVVVSTTLQLHASGRLTSLQQQQTFTHEGYLTKARYTRGSTCTAWVWVGNGRLLLVRVHAWCVYTAWFCVHCSNPGAGMHDRTTQCFRPPGREGPWHLRYGWCMMVLFVWNRCE